MHVPWHVPWDVPWHVPWHMPWHITPDLDNKVPPPLDLRLYYPGWRWPNRRFTGAGAHLGGHIALSFGPALEGLFMPFFVIAVLPARALALGIRIAVLPARALTVVFSTRCFTGAGAHFRN